MADDLKNAAKFTTLAKFTTFAKAKINLSLNVLGKRHDGFHELESLVVFADFGDDLTLDCSKPLGISIEGEFAQNIADIENNLILSAARSFKTRYPESITGHFNLIKNIPVAAGLGGGSSDAASALRLLAKANGIAINQSALHNISEKLGADVPVCLSAKARFMTGIGEKLGEELDLPELYAVLVNPGYAVATADVFKALAAPACAAICPQAQGFNIKANFIAWLKTQKNDLEQPALSLKPEIDIVLSALRSNGNLLFARMSGSGATCFAVYETNEASFNAEQFLKKHHPKWWVKSVTLNASQLNV